MERGLPSSRSILSIRRRFERLEFSPHFFRDCIDIGRLSQLSFIPPLPPGHLYPFYFNLIAKRIGIPPAHNRAYHSIQSSLAFVYPSRCICRIASFSPVHPSFSFDRWRRAERVRDDASNDGLCRRGELDSGNRLDLDRNFNFDRLGESASNWSMAAGCCVAPRTFRIDFIDFDSNHIVFYNRQELPALILVFTLIKKFLRSLMLARLFLKKLTFR